MRDFCDYGINYLCADDVYATKRSVALEEANKGRVGCRYSLLIKNAKKYTENSTGGSATVICDSYGAACELAYRMMLAKNEIAYPQDYMTVESRIQFVTTFMPSSLTNEFVISPLARVADLSISEEDTTYDG